jgi:hypothetical protein
MGGTLKEFKTGLKPSELITTSSQSRQLAMVPAPTDNGEPMYRTLFPRDVFAELDRLQRQMSTIFDGTPSIRGTGRGAYPSLNVGTTPN